MRKLNKIISYIDFNISFDGFELYQAQGADRSII